MSAEEGAPKGPLKKKRRVRKPGAMYFTGISRWANNRVILMGQHYALEGSDDLRTAALQIKDGAWGSIGNFSGISHAIRYAREPEWRVLLLERNRGLYRITVKDDRFERIDEKRDGFLMDLRKIGASWYAVGAHRMIFREEKAGWRPFDDGVYVPGEEGDDQLLLSIDGLSGNDIYAVGYGGTIFHYDGKAWSELDSPTDNGLERVLCVKKDEVYICGYGNSLYRGGVAGWRALTEPDDSITYWDLAFFQGRLYACTKKQLFVLEGDRLEEVKIPVKRPLGFYRMDADGDELWTCGNECVLQFDGKSWTQYVFPDNR
jgi:hypothetical protein